MKVIVRSNENEPYWVGTYQGKDPDMHDVPVVTNEQGEKFWVCGIILPYDELIIKMLDALTPRQQWDTLLKIKRFWDATI